MYIIAYIAVAKCEKNLKKKLFCNGHIQITSSHRIINMERKIIE